MKNWSSPSSLATSTASPVSRRPARPHCWRSDATVPGKPTEIAQSSEPMSMPSSSASVAVTPSSSPSTSRRSISRRCSGVYPARYGASRRAVALSRRSLAKRCTSSAAFRLFVKQIVFLPVGDEAGEEPGRVRERARARAELLVEQLGVPEHDLPVGPRRRVDVDDPDVEPGQARGELAGVRDRRRREDEHGLGAVGEREPAQPAKHVRDVRAEDAAVHVRLVDHDDAQVVERVAPAVVVREDADVEHVGVREDRVRGPADVRPPLDRRVAVVDRRAEAAQAERGEPARLVLRERLRRIEVERPRRRLARDRVERRQREREGLPRRRPGRDDDVLAARDRLPRLRLVRVEAGDAAPLERLGERRVQLVRAAARSGPARPGWTLRWTTSGLASRSSDTASSTRRARARPPRRSGAAAGRRRSSRRPRRRRRRITVGRERTP